ncbi:MAG TPA: DNA gyrase modulator, partial [Nitriliruptorales bacterium]
MNERLHADLAQRAVQAALDAGASYSDARVVFTRTETLQAQDGELENADRSESAGIGVRSLIGSSWGFAATNDLSDARVAETGQRATATAKASALVAGPALVLADVPIVEDHHASAVVEDPFDVPLSEKVDLIVEVSRTMRQAPGIALARGFLTFWDIQQWFVSSQGHRISQHLT